MKIYILDRIERNTAVLECDGQYLNLDAQLLPKEAKEGSVLHKNADGCFVVDAQETQNRQQEMLALQRKVFGTD